jgi:hypothetical protein
VGANKKYIAVTGNFSEKKSGKIRKNLKKIRQRLRKSLKKPGKILKDLEKNPEIFGKNDEA